MARSFRFRPPNQWTMRQVVVLSVIAFILLLGLAFGAVIGITKSISKATGGMEKGSPQPKQTQVIVNVDEPDLKWFSYSIRTATVREIPGLIVSPGDTLVFRPRYDGVDISSVVARIKPQWGTVYPNGLDMEAEKFFMFINHPGHCPMPKQRAVMLLGAIGELTRDQELEFSTTGSYFPIGIGTEVVVPKNVSGKVWLRTNKPPSGAIRNPNKKPDEVDQTWWVAHGFWRVGYAVHRARS